MTSSGIDCICDLHPREFYLFGLAAIHNDGVVGNIGSICAILNCFVRHGESASRMSDTNKQVSSIDGSMLGLTRPYCLRARLVF